MPHVFQIKCYRKHLAAGKAEVGDTVYLKSRPDVPMTVVSLPYWNQTAEPHGPRNAAVKTVRIGAALTGETATETQIMEEWKAEVLTL